MTISTGKKEGIRAPRTKKRFSVRQKVGIALAGGLVVTGLSVGQANAFSITSIAGNIAQLLGVDIAPILDKIAYVEGLAKAVTSGNWGQAAQILTQALGSYGTIDPEKLQKAVKDAALAKYATSAASSDFGTGLAGAIAEEELLTSEIQGQVQHQINSGEDAQQSWMEKGESLADSVQHIADFSTQAGTTTNSLKVLRIISAQTAGHASISGQQLAEQRGIHRSLLEMQNSLNTIAAQGSRNERFKIKGANAASAFNIGTAGLFAGMVNPTGSSNNPQSGAQTPQNPLFGNPQQPANTNLGVPASWTPTMPSNSNASGSSSGAQTPQNPLWGQPQPNTSTSGSSNNWAPPLTFTPNGMPVWGNP